MPFGKIFVTAALVSLTVGAFIYNTPISISPDAVDVEYSPDQGFITVSGRKSL